MRIRMDEEREDRIRRVMQATGENTKSGAIDIALKHYLADRRSKEKVAPELPDELAEQLSTPYLPIERETRVGKV